MKEDVKYIVCTRCFTYNHERYIKDALEGFAIQRTSFPVVSVIVDDASTDSTAEVIRCYLVEHFDLSVSGSYDRDTDYGHITFAEHKTNKQCWFAVVYLKENHYRLRKSKIHYLKEWMDSAKYHAICEGDDYWTDPLKLQKQVQILEQHDDCTMVVTNGVAYYEDKEKSFPINPIPIKDSKFLTISEVLREEGGLIPTASMCYRKELLLNKPSLFNVPYVGDRPLRMWYAINGKVFYFVDPMVIYRKAISGSFTERVRNSVFAKTIYNNMCTFFDSFDAYTNHIYHNDVQYMKDREYYYYCNRIGDLNLLMNAKFFKMLPLGRKIKIISRHIIINVSPSLYKYMQRLKRKVSYK